MIIGVGHVGWCVASLDQAGRALGGLGYREEFRDVGVRNDGSKRPYLHDHRPWHDLALYRSSDGSPPVELVRHGDQPAGREGDPLPTVLLDAPGASDDAPAAPRVAAAVQEAWDSDSAVVVSALDGAPTLRAAIGRGPRIAAYVVPVADQARALSLWSDALGFRCERTGHAWALLRFAAPVRAWRLTVLLVADPARGRRPRYLDEAAITNIALLTTDIAADRQRIGSIAGADVASVFDISVNDRPLRACVARTPDGDIIELLQVRPGASTMT